MYTNQVEPSISDIAKQLNDLKNYHAYLLDQAKGTASSEEKSDPNEPLIIMQGKIKAVADDFTKYAPVNREYNNLNKKEKLYLMLVCYRLNQLTDQLLKFSPAPFSHKQRRAFSFAMFSVFKAVAPELKSFLSNKPLIFQILEAWKQEIETIEVEDYKTVLYYFDLKENTIIAQTMRENSNKHAGLIQDINNFLEADPSVQSKELSNLVEKLFVGSQAFVQMFLQISLTLYAIPDPISKQVASMFCTLEQYTSQIGRLKNNLDNYIKNISHSNSILSPAENSNTALLRPSKYLY